MANNNNLISQQKQNNNSNPPIIVTNPITNPVIGPIGHVNGTTHIIHNIHVNNNNNTNSNNSQLHNNIKSEFSKWVKKMEQEFNITVIGGVDRTITPFGMLTLFTIIDNSQLPICKERDNWNKMIDTGGYIGLNKTDWGRIVLNQGAGLRYGIVFDIITTDLVNCIILLCPISGKIYKTKVSDVLIGMSRYDETHKKNKQNSPKVIDNMGRPFYIINFNPNDMGTWLHPKCVDDYYKDTICIMCGHQGCDNLLKKNRDNRLGLFQEPISICISTGKRWLLHGRNYYCPLHSQIASVNNDNVSNPNKRKRNETETIKLEDTIPQLIPHED